MITATAISVKIDAEAKERIDELGMQREFDRMIEHTKQLIPDLLALHVELGYDYEEGGEPMLVINAHRPEPESERYDKLDLEWGMWKLREFPREVSRHFMMMCFYEPYDAR